MDAPKILGKLCGKCHHLVQINEKNHNCSLAQPQYKFQKILPKIQYTDHIYNNKDDNDDDDDEELYTKLINAVHERHPLWDYRVPSSRDRSIKLKLWNEIYNELNCEFSIDVLKRKWKYLRENYVRQKKKPASLVEGGKKKTWSHMKNLQFLDDVMSYKKIIREKFVRKKKRALSGTMGVEKKLWSDTNNLQFLDNVIMNNEKKTTNLNSSSDEPKANKRSNDGSVKEVILNEFRQKIPVPPVHTEDQLDEDLSFGKYLTTLMKNLPKKKKLELQAEFICKVIANTPE